MRRAVTFVGRLLLAAALAYLVVGVVWQTAFELALAGPGAPESGPWEGLFAFVAWFVLPSALWPASMNEFVPGGGLIAVVLFVLMTALMFGALMRLAPGIAAPTGPRRPPRPRSAPRARAGRPRTS